MSQPLSEAAELLRRDAARWLAPTQLPPPPVSWPQVVPLLHRHRSLRAVAWFRVGSWARRNGVPFVGGAIQRRIMRVHGLELSVGAEIGGGLYVAHPVGTTIFAERVGADLTVIHAVTVGYRGRPARWPVIGDGVFLGAGCRVLGGVVVGDGAQVGANAVVLHDVPAGATAVGIPARVVGAQRLAS